MGVVLHLTGFDTREISYTLGKNQQKSEEKSPEIKYRNQKSNLAG